MFAERYDEADRLYSGALEDARRRGSGIAFATASSLRSLVAYRRGRLAEAHADASRRAGAGRRRARLAGLPLGRARHARLHRARPGHGRRRRSRRSPTASCASRRPTTSRTATRCTAAPACASTAASSSRRYQELLATGRRELEWGARNPAVTPWRSTAALVAHELGDARAARELAFEEVELARAFGAPRALGVALRAAGLVAERRGGDRAAGRGGRRARALARRARARPRADRPRAALARRRRRRSARGCAAGHALAIRCGATALAAPRGREPGAGARGADGRGR